MLKQLSSEGYVGRRGGVTAKVIATILTALLVFTMLAPPMARPAQAQVAPPDGQSTRSIEIFHNREMVLITGYDPGSTVKIEVVRNGQPIGAVTRTVLPDGTYEINHTGAAANDCWGPGVEGSENYDPSAPNVTPDIKPGDIVRTTVLELADGTQPENDVNSSVTRDVYLDFDALVADEGDPELDGDGTITVKGHARSTEAAPIDLEAGDVVGIGLRKANRDSPWGDGQDGRKVLTAELTDEDIADDGSITYVFNNIVEEDIEDVQLNGVDQSIEWTPAVVEPNEPPELTVFDASEGVPPGCPPLEGAAPIEEPAPNVNQDLSPDANLSAPIEEGRTMEVVHGIEFVVLEGYPANAEVRVDVVRGTGENVVVIGSATQRTDGTGLMEINHLGEGQFPNGDCWDYPGTPDIQPGDVVMATVLGAQGNDTPDVDTTVVRDVVIDTPGTPDTRVDRTANTITLTGHIRNVAGAPPIDLVNDVLELRLNANGFGWDVNNERKDLRAQVQVANIDPVTGEFTHTFNVSANDAAEATTSGFEQSIEWSPAVVEPNEPSEITVHNGTDLEGVGCPPHLGGTPANTPGNANAITGSSHKFVNAANQGDQQITLSGTSYGKDEVQVSVAGAEATVPVGPAGPNGLQTWRATVNVSDLAGLPQGPIEAIATFVDSEAAATDPIASDTAEMMKDTDPPAAPTASVASGEYTTAQRVTLSAGDGDKIYYSTTLNDPDTGQPITDTLYLSRIQVNETQTINAVAVDRAGNVSGEASFAYTITPPPNTKPTVTEMRPDGVTIRNKRPTIAATVADKNAAGVEETNLSRNDIRLIIRGQEIRTFSYNRATDRLTYTPRKNLRRGLTPVRIIATDAHGGRANVLWTFTVRR